MVRDIQYFLKSYLLTPWQDPLLAWSSASCSSAPSCLEAKAGWENTSGLVGRIGKRMWVALRSLDSFTKKPKKSNGACNESYTHEVICCYF